MGMVGKSTPTLDYIRRDAALSFWIIIYPYRPLLCSGPAVSPLGDRRGFFVGYVRLPGLASSAPPYQRLLAYMR
jgi:hypothetical protein